MKRIRKLILIGLMGWIFIMTGCAGIGKTKEDVAIIESSDEDVFASEL